MNIPHHLCNNEKKEYHKKDHFLHSNLSNADVSNFKHCNEFLFSHTAHRIFFISSSFFIFCPVFCIKRQSVRAAQFIQICVKLRTKESAFRGKKRPDVATLGLRASSFQIIGSRRCEHATAFQLYWR